MKSKTLYCVLLLLSLLLAAAAAGRILGTTPFIWNNIRLARSVALARGYPIYCGAEQEAPVIGTLHLPVSHILLTPAALAPNPEQALRVGATLCALFGFGPLLWLHWRLAKRDPGRRTLAWGLALLCGLFLVQSGGGYYAIFRIHTDAAGLGFSTLAIAVIYLAGPGLGLGTMAFSAAMAVLAVLSKQTLAPIPAALALYLLLTEGWRRCLQYAALLAGLAAAGALLLHLGFGPAVWFNTLTLPAHRPLKQDWPLALGTAWRNFQPEGAYGVIPVLFCFLLQVWEPGGFRNPRRLLHEQRWLVFALAGLAMVPFVLKATITEGGAENHLGALTYLFLLASSIAIYHFVRAERDHPFLARAGKAWMVILILISLPGNLARLANLLHPQKDPSQLAYEYAQRHPNRVYFVWCPLAALYAEGKVYHFDYALYDRELAGYPLTDAQFRAGAPEGSRWIAFPPQVEVTSRRFKQLLKGYRAGGDSELPGWRVYRPLPAFEHDRPAL